MIKYANRYNIDYWSGQLESILLKASDIKIILPKVKEADITSMVQLKYFNNFTVW